MDPSHNNSPHESHIISQQVFGSSKKLQFIGISPMDSLLSAIDQQTQQTKSSTTHQTMSIESLLDSNGETTNKRHYNSIVEENLLMKSVKRKLNNNNNNNNNNYMTSTPTTTTTINNNKNNQSQQSLPHLTSQMTTITCYHAAVAQKSYGSEKRFLCPPPIVQVQSPNSNISSSCQLAMAVVSENGEKPLEQHATLDDNQCTFKYLHVTGTAKAKQFSLRINITSTSDHSSTEETDLSNNTTSPLYATFLSNPISIISKPSKKTSKARNVSTCVLANQPVSLFNRINSQTVRTKYMTSDNQKLCAKNSSWSPFEIIVLHQPTQYQSVTSNQRPQSTTTTTSSSSSNNNNNNNNSIQPLIYGSEIIIKDTKTNICSQPVIIRKVDKGRIIPGAYGPVSQMQKIALQLSSSPSSSPLYLSAISASETNDTGVVPAHSPHASILDFAPSRIIPDGLDTYEKVEDYLCWTIVGISTFEYSFYDNQAQPSSSSISSSSSSINNDNKSTCSSPNLKYLSSPSPSNSTSSSSTPPSTSSLCSFTSSPISSPSFNHHHFQHHAYNKTSLPIDSTTTTTTNHHHHPVRCITPFPIITSIQYKPLTHSLDIIGQHLMQAVPSPKLLQLWLGSHHEPLKITLQPQPPQPHQTHLLVDLPSTQDLIVANHDRLKSSSSNTNNGRRILELPLYFVREDGVVYHSGKALICEMLIHTDAGRWSIVDVRQ